MNDIANTLRNLLAHNVVSFTYRKVNGEIRHAIGTRSLVLAEQHIGIDIPKPRGEEQPNSYYDIGAIGWRSYKPENLISIDQIYDTEVIPKAETKREIPVVNPPYSGAEIHTPTPALDGIVGGLMGGIFGGGIPQEEIRKSMDKLNKDIVIGAPAHSPKVGTPVATERGIELPVGGVPVEDFAKMVAHYVVEELITRLTR